MEVTFVTCGDRPYGPTIELTVRNLSVLHPRSRLLVYDWGLAADTRSRLSEAKGVEAIAWKRGPFSRLACYRLAHKVGWARYQHIVRAVPGVRRVIGSRVTRLLGLELALIEKIKCLVDASARTGPLPLVFLDGDAVPVGPLDELFGGEDLIVTVRRENEISWEFDRCSVLNSGVIGFGSDVGVRSHVLDRWLLEADASSEMIAEQTALTRILERSNRGILSNRGRGRAEIGGKNVNVVVLSGDRFNFNHIEEIVGADGGIPEDIRVLHFKSGRFRNPDFRGVIAAARLDH